MTKEEAKLLFEKYRQGTCTPEERAMIDSWYLASMHTRPDTPISDEDAAWQKERVLASLKATYFNDQPKVRPLRYWYAAAATLAVFLTMGYFFLLRPSDPWQTIAASEVDPGSNRATLTLADGRTIDLSETQQGIVVSDESITYNDGSSLDVISSEAEGRRDISLLELTTPKGGTYQITLPDGTKVWLNANSTLKYPSRFSRAERVVELTGEAYFDVSEQVTKGTSEHGAQSLTRSQPHTLTTSQKTPFKVPFLVKTNAQTVEVLGTQFNISAYPDANETQTTLVEGKVRLLLARELSEASPVPDKQVVLSPGEQARLIDGVIETGAVDVSQYTAWRDGLFHFSGDLEHILQQVGRWYDVEVVFKDEALKKQQFFGVVYRDRTLDEVLKMLENTAEIQFNVQTNGTERRVAVMR